MVGVRVLVLTVGGIEEGSTKYRIGQYLPYLESLGISCRLVHRDRVNRQTQRLAAEADVVLNQKCLFSNQHARAILARCPAAVFDFDDAIYTRPGKPYGLLTGLRLNRRLHLWLRRAALVVPANGELASYARRFTASERVRVLPMAVDTDLWRPATAEPGGLTIGWAGSPGNLPYLEALDPVLSRILATVPQAQLLVYCGRRPALSCPFEYVPYSPGTEADFVRRLQIGLLPLPDTAHARGKSPIKSLQYLACGVPVVGNFVGATAEICRPGFSCAVTAPEDWLQAVNRLAGAPAMRREMGRLGREFIEQNHSRQRCGGVLADILQQAGSTSGRALEASVW